MLPDAIKVYAEWSAAAAELVGIAVILLVALYALIYGVVLIARRRPFPETFDEVRQRLGRGILLGLEFLVAADIIYTVAVELTFSTVATLAIIVLVRTFLSFTLEVEITGRWPWQNAEGTTESEREPDRGRAA